MEEVQDLLSELYTDMLMLKDGSWQPDKHTCDASIDAIETIALKLNLTVSDNRDED